MAERINPDPFSNVRQQIRSMKPEDLDKLLSHVRTQTTTPATPLVPEATVLPKTEPEATVESTEQKTDRLISHISRAEFDSFQEYSFVSTRSGKGFASSRIQSLVTSDGNYGDYDLNREDDIVQYYPDYMQRYHHRSVIIPYSIARMIDPSLVIFFAGQQELKNEHELYCLVGKKDEKVIIQGGGVLHMDSAKRPNPSTFKLVFDSENTANEYLHWLQVDPKEAYGTVLRRTTGSYNEQGNFKQALIPPVSNREHFYDPFSVSPDKVVVKDLRIPNQPAEAPEQIEREYNASQETTEDNKTPLSVTTKSLTPAELELQQMLEGLIPTEQKSDDSASVTETATSPANPRILPQEDIDALLSDSGTKVAPIIPDQAVKQITTVTNRIPPSSTLYEPTVVPIAPRKAVRELIPNSGQNLVQQANQILSESAVSQVTIQATPDQIIGYLKVIPPFEVGLGPAKVQIAIKDIVARSNRNQIETTGVVNAAKSDIKFTAVLTTDQNGQLRVIKHEAKLPWTLKMAQGQVNNTITHLGEKVTDIINQNINPSWQVAGYRIVNNQMSLDFRRK